MDSARVRAVLQGVQDRSEVAASREERDPLVAQGLLEAVDATVRDRWTAGVANLPSLRDRVRELSRQALATPGPTAPPELRRMISELEELTRQRTALDSLAWNGPTQEYLSVTLPGRSVLADLATWQARLGGRTFEQFQQEMGVYRQGLLQTINRAGLVYRGLLFNEQLRLGEIEEMPTDTPLTQVDLRFASMILAKRPLDPTLLVRSFEFYHHETNWGSRNKDDRLIASAVLASLPSDLGPLRWNFERLRIELESHGILPEDRIIVAASLADLPQDWWSQVFPRLDELRRTRPGLNALLASLLARSPYAPTEALGRFDGAMSGMASRGWKDGIHLEAAAAILAAAPIPADVLVERFATVLPHIEGAFHPAHAPAAMLATGPLEPLEAVDVFRDCIGAVTRTNFFELTLEIEELALIMSYGVAPLGAGYLAAGLPEGAPLVPPVPVVPMAPALGTSWFVWHNYWVYRPVGRYIATHPVHVHTVAAFG